MQQTQVTSTQKATNQTSPRLLFKKYERIKKSGGVRWEGICRHIPQNLKTKSLLEIYIRPLNSTVPFERRFFVRKLLESYYINNKCRRVAVTKDTNLENINVIEKYEDLESCNRRAVMYAMQIGYEIRDANNYLVIPEKKSISKEVVCLQLLPTTDEIKELLQL